MDILTHNLSFVPKLNPEKQGIVTDFLTYSFDRNILFQITSGIRTYLEQLEIYTKDRTIDDCLSDMNRGQITLRQFNDLKHLYDTGKNVYDTDRRTWTLNSEHLTGNAIDLQLINTTHAELSLVAMKWNIVHSNPFQDPPHYTITNAMVAEPEIQPTPEARARGFAHRIQTEPEPVKSRLIARLEKNSLWPLIKQFIS